MLHRLIGNKKIWLVAVVVLAAFLLLFRLTRADIQTDDSIYSFRAVGYLDYVDSQLQTTPINWFEKIPWWSKLSFHDAPPLVFIIQFLFFKLFGVSLLTARLPFALAGIGSVILVYFLVKRLYNQQTALLASFILSIMSFHNWANKVGYLESIALFFILLTFYLFLLGFKKPKRFIWFGIALGFTLLTKYTTFFIIPVIFFYLLFKNKKLFFNKYFIISVIIAILIFSPVIFYNFKMYQTRGHFDLQLAGLFHQDMSDWPGMAGAELSKDYFNQIINTWRLSGLISLPLYLLSLLAIIFIIIDFTWSWQKLRNLFIILVLIFITIQFALVGPSTRFLSLMNPFIAITLSVFLLNIYHFLAKNKTEDKLTKSKKTGYIAVLIIVFSFELFYNINTNILYQPLGERGKHYSSSRFENGGFNQLEEYLIREGNLASLKIFSIKTKEDIFEITPQKYFENKDVFIYDPNLSWFSSLWYFRRWAVYYRIFFISASDMAIVLGNSNWFDFLNGYGVNNVYYIQGSNILVRDPGYQTKVNQELATTLETIFQANNSEVKKINNINNQSAFLVYKLNLNN